MKKTLLKFPIAIILIAIYSCSDSNKASNDAIIDEVDLVADTIIEIEEKTDNAKNEDLDAIVSLFNFAEELPFDLDTIYIADIINSTKNYEALNTEQVKYLAANLMEEGPSEFAIWDLEGFYKMDSIKSNGKYDEYMENIDLGMLQTCEIHAIWNIPYKSGNILIWRYTYATMDACPYASGTKFFMTVTDGENIGSTAVLAVEMSGGDPPSFMSESTYGKISADGKITVMFKEIFGEHDGGDAISEETKEKTYKFNILEKGEIKFIKVL